ncbi:MAG: type II methionyl aminopeptidase [Candidatus Thermoplasmatota archaeon]|jgi:methionyl aminopeptidase|nr:type II methionyl aminopeptidase [Candidatus Thermoplasmatota archaeon]MCL5790579.1 type II methionyl aminopeptidase [Candidatus Thermoplasmatota archaeon]
MDTQEKNKILEAGKLGRMALEYAQTLIEPGALFLEVAEKTEDYIRENGGKPSFPLNLSINNEAAHYTPSPNDKKTFRTGDLVKVDIGAQVDGYISDNAASMEVGGKGQYSDLVDCTREALNAALKVLRPGIEIYRIGEAIGSKIESFGFKPVKNLGGHGIARYDLHSTIFIPNYDDGNGRRIEPGQLIAIEPFASTGIGMIHNGPGGNIYIFSGTKPKKGDPVIENFSTLPFAERWLAKVMPDYRDYLRKNLFMRQISHFSVLKEHKGAMISQAEHTILFDGDQVIVTTL